MSANELMGWGFLGFAIARTLGIGIEERSLTNGIAWAILGKLCWIHSDIKST